MSAMVRWAVAVVALLHGLIHLLPAAGRLGWLEDPALEQSGSTGALWLAAGLSLLLAAGLAAWDVRPWWLMTLGAATVSQVAIVTAWPEARTGTLANVLLVVLAVYAWLSEGGRSLHGQWRTGAQEALAAAPAAGPPITEDDLAGLPAPVAAYVARSGAVGQPRPQSILAEFRGRIRAGRGEPWMPFTGRQVTTFGSEPRRLFVMDATRGGLPVTVLHRWIAGRARMQATVLAVATILDVQDAELDRGETVTVFNDLVVLAPGAIVGAPIRWTQVDEHRVRGALATGPHEVSAELTFGVDGRLLDFVSHDRPRAWGDGTGLTREPWSTPAPWHRRRGGEQRVSGTARWHDPDGWFTYVEIEFRSISKNAHQHRGRSARQDETSSA